MSAPVKLKERIRMEIEVATVLLGFLFVMNSVLITMSNDILDLIKKAGLMNFLFGFIRWLPFIDAISFFTFYCSLFLFSSILFYLLYINIEKTWILNFARTFLVFGMFIMALLIQLFSGIFLWRLFGEEGNIYLNPIFGISFSVGFIATIIFIVILWYKESASLRRLIKKGNR